MTRTSIFRAARLVLATLVMAGCASGVESPTAPIQPTAPEASLLSALPPVHAVSWKHALGSDVTASATIGSAGGVLSLPQTGLTVVIPRGAVSKATAFSVTAVAGSEVAYEFEPHGTTFKVALQATQDMRLTNSNLVTGLLLEAGYFPTRNDLLEGAGTALVSETIQGLLGTLTQRFAFPIKHFSGYVIAW